MNQPTDQPYLPVPPSARARVGARAARVLVSELARRPGPTTALLLGADPAGPVLAAAMDALRPDDTLLVLGTDPPGWEGEIPERVRVIESLGAAYPVDLVIVAEPVLGTAESARATLDELSKLLAPGGVVTVAAVAVPGLAPGAVKLGPAAMTAGSAPLHPLAAGAELDRQAMLYGVGSDLVLRNLPPLRVHRLRWTPPDPALADRVMVSRPSSVPVTPEMHVDSHGVAAAGIALGLAGLTRLARPGSRLWLLPAAAALPLLAFFRDPQREPPADPALVVAASDGRVLSVERVTDDRFSGDGSPVDYLRVAVFLSVLDVHVNRAPVAGEVVDHFLTDGGYAAAMTPAGEHNVAGYTVLQTARGRVAVAQRTGLLARRIVHRAPVGSVLARGERFGLIRFGSRTDVYLPAGGAEILVAVGDRVIGGTTPLARWR